MGLGLAIIKNIIESYQGSIQFTSIAFQKTEFIVNLPLHSNEIS
jgi:signal transduction histidine kinase